MKIFIKTLLWLTVGGFVFFVVLLNVHAQELTNDTAKQVEFLKLKTDQLLDSQEVTPETIDSKTKQMITLPPIVIYSYVGDEVDDAKNIIFNNSNLSNTEQIDDNHLKVYLTPRFFKDNNNFVHKIEIATTTTEIWDKASVPTLDEKILSLFRAYPALADTASTSAAYVCALVYGSPTTHDCTAGDLYIHVYNTSDNARNIGLQFTMPAGSGTISAVDLKMYKSSREEYSQLLGVYKVLYTDADYSMITWSQYKTATAWQTGGAYGASDTSLVTAFNFNAPTGWNTFNLTTGADNPMTINWGDIVKLVLRPQAFSGTSHYEDVWNGSTGTNPPYVLITYASAPPTPPAASSTPMFCAWPTNDDISIITGCLVNYEASTSATTSIEMIYYKIPFVLYWFIVSIFVIGLIIIAIVLFNHE